MYEIKTIPDLLNKQAEQFPEKPFIIWVKDEKRLSYRKFDEVTNQLAAGFKELGLKKGDHVAMMLPNCLEAWYTWFATNKLGAVCIPINIYLKGEGLRYVLDHSDAKFLIINSELYRERFREDVLPITLFEKLERIIFVNDVIPQEGIETHVISELYKSQEIEKVEVKGRDVAGIIYTSGTTGPPKGVVITHAYYIHTGKTWAEWLGLLPTDRIFCCLPIYHMNAQGYQTMGTLWSGCTMVLDERFSASNFWKIVRKYYITQFNYIGTVPMILLKRPEDSSDSENSIRVMMGAACPKEIWRLFENRFNVILLEAYGLTECSLATILTLDGWKEGKIGSAGKPVIEGIEVKVVRDDGTEADTMEVGEIIIKAEFGEKMFLEYYKDPERTKESIKNGWFYTGDLGYFDEDGYLWFVDRKKDALRVRGEMVSSWMVEKVLTSHPKVLEAAVIGVKSELGEQDIKAFVVVKEGERLDYEELIKWCDERLAYFMVPRYIEYVQELPKTPTHKIQKYKLREIGLTGREWDREKAGYIIRKR